MSVDSHPFSNPWSPWQEKFYWYPKRIIINTNIDEGWAAGVNIRTTKWIWLKTIYVRRRCIVFYPDYRYEYEYAEDLFDLINRESH
jgi:hypothetical protein